MKFGGAERELFRRVSVLDDDCGSSATGVAPEVEPDVVRFVSTLGIVVNTSRRDWPTPITAPLADAIVGDCKLIQRLRLLEPRLVDQGVASSTQAFITTALASRSSVRHVLNKSHLRSFKRDDEIQFRTKPVYRGMFSSTLIRDTPGMWWAYLRVNEWSTLFPKPWTVSTFVVPREANVLEVCCAEDWVRAVERYGIVSDDLLFPNWNELSASYDGMHVSATAVLATQGIPFSSGASVIPPTYWDVESTLWFRWVFGDVRPSPGSGSLQ